MELKVNEALFEGDQFAEEEEEEEETPAETAETTETTETAEQVVEEAVPVVVEEEKPKEVTLDSLLVGCVTNSISYA